MKNSHKTGRANLLSKLTYQGEIFGKVFRSAFPDTIYVYLIFLDAEYIVQELGWVPQDKWRRVFRPPVDTARYGFRLFFYSKTKSLKIEFEVWKLIADTCMVSYDDLDLNQIIVIIKNALRLVGLYYEDSICDFTITRYDTRLFGLPISTSEYSILYNLLVNLRPSRKGDVVHTSEKDMKDTWLHRGLPKPITGIIIYPIYYSADDSIVIPQIEYRIGNAGDVRERFNRLNQGNRNLSDVISDIRLTNKIFLWGLNRYGLLNAPILESNDVTYDFIYKCNANKLWKTNALNWLSGNKSTGKDYFKDIQKRYYRTVSFTNSYDSIDLRNIFDFDSVKALAGYNCGTK